MTMAQFGRRLRISPQSVLDLETRERNETISLRRLRAAAAALECDVKIVFVPRSSLESTAQRQAERRAGEERSRLIHTMRLENQEDGTEYAIDKRRAIERWLTRGARRLWD